MQSLPSFRDLNLTYIGSFFAGKVFRNKTTGQESTYSSQSRGFGDPVFLWNGRPMHFVAGSRFGICAHFTKEQRDRAWDTIKAR